MVRSIKLALAAGVIAAAIAPSVGAHYLEKPCNGVVTTHTTDAGKFYTDHRTAQVENENFPGELNNPVIGKPQPGEDGGSWIYLETNGHGGLQSGGSHAVLGSEGDALFRDPCVSDHKPASGALDSIVF
jgi:hypothetical protein